ALQQTSHGLSLEQKVGQLFIIGFDGAVITPQTEKMFNELKPGGVLLLKKNIQNAKQVKKRTTDLQALSMAYSGLPLFIAVDQEGGSVSRLDFLREKTAQFEIETTQEAYAIGLTRGKELKELGVNLNFAPLLDIAASGDFIFDRTFQKDALQTSKLAASLAMGQKEAGILSCFKHFPGYGGIAFNPEEKLATLTKAPSVSQFQEATIKIKPEFVMVSNVVFEDIDSFLPFSFLENGVKQIKQAVGASPLIITDDLAQNSVLKRFSLEQIVGLPLMAGNDMLIFSGWKSPVAPAVLAAQEMVKSGQVAKDKVDKAVSRIIKQKEKMLE
ncbi:MAG: glycoside hydrolase family 3 N-terminal domain-containing protein, partial [Patescibacteria group bacterium]